MIKGIEVIIKKININFKISNYIQNIKCNTLERYDIDSSDLNEKVFVLLENLFFSGGQNIKLRSYYLLSSVYLCYYIFLKDKNY